MDESIREESESLDDQLTITCPSNECPYLVEPMSFFRSSKTSKSDSLASVLPLLSPALRIDRQCSTTFSGVQQYSYYRDLAIQSGAGETRRNEVVNEIFI